MKHATLLTKAGLTLLLVAFMFIGLSVPGEQAMPPLLLGIMVALAGGMVASAVLLKRLERRREANEIPFNELSPRRYEYRRVKDESRERPAVADGDVARDAAPDAPRDSGHVERTEKASERPSSSGKPNSYGLGFAVGLIVVAVYLLSRPKR